MQVLSGRSAGGTGYADGLTGGYGLPFLHEYVTEVGIQGVDIAMLQLHAVTISSSVTGEVHGAGQDGVDKKVFRGENYVRLGPTEFRILKLLIANPRHVFSREDLLREVWGNSVYVETRTVDVHIRRLRKALNEFGSDYIRTIRATGYSIDDHELENDANKDA